MSSQSTNNKRIAKNKLNSMTNLKKIGITGSYAKTSVKEILKIILSEKSNIES